MKQAVFVAVENTAYDFDHLFTYGLPEQLQGKVTPGQRVAVPFGAGNRTRVAIVLELENREALDGLKLVANLVDEAPLLGEEGIRLLQYLKEHTFCTYFDALRCLIPAGIGVEVKPGYRAAPKDHWPQELTAGKEQILTYLSRRKKPVEQGVLFEELGITDKNLDFRQLLNDRLIVKEERLKRRIQDQKLTMVRLTDLEGEVKLTPKQKKVAEFLGEIGCASLKEVCYFTAVGKTVVDKLCAAGAAEYFEYEVYRNPYAGRGVDPNREAVNLSAEQQAAYERLAEQLKREPPGVSLLFGVTGSGKTQVFIKLIEQVLAQGRQVIVMVPEISLTPQTLEIFHRRFGSKVAVMHSGLSLSERMDEWKRIKTGKANIVIGTRSAVFAPLQNIGLIVMDEEQEQTYKSEKSPRFHAREVAKFRCAWHKAGLVLASATPSVESYYLAKTGRYQLVELRNRFNQAPLPHVHIVDMSEHAASAATALSDLLIDELYINYTRGEQSILLLNRRGYSTLVKCTECGQVATCPHCSVSLTYHSANGQLVCHYCGYSQPVGAKCPSCGSTLVRYGGLGTQKLEEQLQTLFSDARILRMDMDTTMSKFAYEEKLKAFGEKKYDMMIGTQMVAKGLDFPNVTLVGILAADQSLYAQDFRSFERSFSLITQVVGRCGRGDLPGRAFIQTYTPSSPVIHLAATQKYEAFFHDEIADRKLHLYPPFCDLYLIGFLGERLEAVKSAAERFAGAFGALASAEYANLPIRVLGPCEASVLRVAGRYRYRMVIKCRDTVRMRELVHRLLEGFGREKQNRGVSVFADPYFDGSW